MKKSRRQQVNDALAINSLDSVPVDSEIMDLLDAYANHEIEYDELSKKLTKKLNQTLKIHNLHHIHLKKIKKLMTI